MDDMNNIGDDHTDRKRVDEWLRAEIISRLEQLQREGLWSDKRRDEFEGLLQLTTRFPPEYLRGAEFQARSAVWKNRMN